MVKTTIALMTTRTFDSNIYMHLLIADGRSFNNDTYVTPWLWVVKYSSVRNVSENFAAHRVPCTTALSEPNPPTRNILKAIRVSRIIVVEGGLRRSNREEGGNHLVCH